MKLGYPLNPKLGSRGFGVAIESLLLMIEDIGSAYFNARKNLEELLSRRVKCFKEDCVSWVQRNGNGGVQ